MVARVTLAEIDTVRVSVEDVVERFKDLIAPALREQPGYRGFYALATPEGRALVMTLWESEEAADTGLRSGFYTEQVAKLVTFYKAPPGRETYEVVLAETPAGTTF